MSSNAWERRQARIHAATAALRDLSADELADVLLSEYDHRRLDADGNPTEAPGTYEAATVSMLALLGQPLDEADDRAAADLTAVGRGAMATEGASREWEMHDLVEAMHGSQIIPEADKAPTLARTLEKRWGCEVDVDAIAEALNRDGPWARLASTLMALGERHANGEDGVKARLREARKRYRKRNR